MKSTISILLLIILTGFTSADGWFLFKTETFSIEFPVKPNSEIQTVNSEIGELKMHIHMFDASTSSRKDENLVYMVVTTEYPDSLVSSDNKEQLTEIFRNGVDGAVKNINGKLLSEKTVELDGFPGREIRVDFKDGLAIIKMRMYLVKNKMYMIEVITKAEKELNKSSDKFINSFKLNK